MRKLLFILLSLLYSGTAWAQTASVNVFIHGADTNIHQTLKDSSGHKLGYLFFANNGIAYLKRLGLLLMSTAAP